MVACKTLGYADYILSFELHFCDVKTTDLNKFENNPKKPEPLEIKISSSDSLKENISKRNFSETSLYPVDTRRRFNVYKTAIRRRRRRIDVL